MAWCHQTQKHLAITCTNIDQVFVIWYLSGLTLKHWEMHGCVVSTVATDALVLKHQAISIHNAD